MASSVLSHCIVDNPILSHPLAPGLAVAAGGCSCSRQGSARPGWVEKELETALDAVFNSPADLDELFAAGKVAEKQYWKERLNLKAPLMVTLKKASPSPVESYATRHTSSR
jgi:hypothetical protein